MDGASGSGSDALKLASPVFRFEDLDSTNSEAKRRAQTGDISSCWIVSERQSSGRGRLQRAWTSPRGNLYATALFEEPGGFQVATRLPFALALSVRETCARFTPDAHFRLKWPNDVRVEGQKISGILIETGTLEGRLWIAAGIGINIASSPNNTDKPATSLSALGAGPGATVQSVFDALANAFVSRLNQARDGFGSVRTDWLQHAEGLGRTVSVKLGGEPVQGVLEDMDDTGGLVLRLPDGSVKTIRAGDVSLIGRV